MGIKPKQTFPQRRYTDGQEPHKKCALVIIREMQIKTSQERNRMSVWFPEGKGGVRWERIVWEFGIHMDTLLFLKQMTNKNHCKK